MLTYIVRFIRVDGSPNEDYYYMNKEDAVYHFSLFLDDDSNLYSKIVLMCSNGLTVDEHVF